MLRLGEPSPIRMSSPIDSSKRSDNFEFKLSRLRLVKDLLCVNLFVKTMKGRYGKM